MRPSGARAGRRGALLLALALLLLMPAALADHAYSHRVYVMGRVLDVDGRPAAGVPVNLTFHGMSAPHGCFDNKPEVTGARGDFEVCRHAHDIPPDASVTVRVGETASVARIDPHLRVASVRLQVNESTTHDVSGERQFARVYDVVGRAYALLPRPHNEEGVMVNATPIYDNVTVQLRVLDRILASQEVSPDEHGTFRAQLQVEEVPAAAVVRASVGRDLGEDVASPTFRRTDVNIVRDLRLIDGPGDDAPGSSPTPLAAALAVGALAVAAARRRR